MATISATCLSATPPSWAILERQLIAVLDQAIHPFLEKYTRADGTLIWRDEFVTRDGADDGYESFHNWPLLYVLGGGDQLLDLAVKEWDAVTRQFTKYGQIHKEFERGYDWFHQGESCIYFYYLSLANPARRIQLERARRFAGFYLNEDPDALNYDSNRKLIRAPHNRSEGPRCGFSDEDPPRYVWSEGMRSYGLPFHDVPGISQYDDLKDPALESLKGQVMHKRLGRGDVPANLAATSLVTNAYLHTGDEKYKRWVLEYVEVWLDRMRRHDGIMPDHVGPTGKIGEQREGQGWGGWDGWNCYKGMDIGLTSITIGAECAHLLTGDDSYLDLIRSQMHVLFENSKVDDKGQRLFSWRYGPDGWFDYKPMPIKWLPHLYHASLSTNDRQLMEQVRDGDVERDWGSVPRINAKSGGDWAFFHYHDGKFPDWPERLMESELTQAQEALDRVKSESRSSDQIISENTGIPNPVSTCLLYTSPSPRD